MASSAIQDAHAGGRTGQPTPDAGLGLSVPNLAGLGREVGPGRGQEVLALPDAQVSSLGAGPGLHQLITKSILNS